MNIYVMLVLLLWENASTIPAGRGALRHQRERAITHNRAVYKNRIRGEIWYDKKYHDYDHTQVKHPEWEGKFVGYHGSIITDEPQEGRWATERLSDHRRFQKWSRNYYPSWTDTKARLRWDEELRDYLG